MDDQPSASIVFGSRVRDRRLELELSQETVAKLAQMNVSNYGKVERGLGNPTLLTLVRIAVVLGTDPGTFLTGLGAESLPASPATYTAADFIAAREAAANNADHSDQK
jgi:transcriptional regulator with XRE-family HTH domain